MKIAVYVNLLAIACSAVAFPGKIPFDAPDELELTRPVSRNAYDADLPGSRIIGGVELAPHSAPYQAALFINGNVLCSGSLITTTRVLTTAYCTWDASFVEVRLGAHRYNEEEDTQVRVTSTSVIVHDSFNIDRDRNYDIAIIFLPAQVTLNDYVKVVALAPATAGSYEGSWGLVSGWGTTTDASSLLAPALRGVYVNIMSTSDCLAILGGQWVFDLSLCTSGTGIVGTCYWDYGDPLVTDGLLVGIASFNLHCTLELPSVYTRVSSYRSWIDTYADL